MFKHVQIFLFFLVFITYCQSQTILDTSNKETEFKPNIQPILDIKKSSNNSIIIDGILNENEWKDASIADNFTEISPGENVKPEVDTKAYITYDNEYLYMGFICWEDMQTLRVSMCDRDRMFNDDWIGAFIDTYNDQKQAFEFYTNAYGIQGDLVWSTNYEDSSPDFIYDSEAKTYKDKWTAEIRIPFKSLKFPDVSEQTWRVHIIRNRYRGFRQEIYWASVDKNDPSFLKQAGLWKGLKNIKKGKNLEFLPYVIGNLNANNFNTSDKASKLKYGKLDGDAGLGLKYGLSSNLTWDLVINPDFSQVEADAPRIDINTASALFFEEKRPFFLEGINVFRGMVNLLHTRSIVNPIFATKLTGKIKKFDIGFMSALDENSPYIIPHNDGSFFLTSNKNSLSNILRMKYDFGGEDYLGVTYTDREESADSNKVFDYSGYNRVASIDGRFAFLNNYYFGFQFLYYFTKELNDTSIFNNSGLFGNDKKYNFAFNGESFNGPGINLNFERQSRSWSFFSEYNYQSPSARRYIGYLDFADYQSLYLQSSYSYYSDSKLLYKIIPKVALLLRHTTDNKLKEQFVEPQLTINFRNGLTLYGNYALVNNEQFGGIWHKNVNRLYAEVSYNYNNKISGMIGYERGKYIVRYLNPSIIGDGQNIYISLTINPIDRIRIGLDYNYADLFRSDTKGSLYSGYVISATTYFVFNKNFFLRVVSQYDDFDKVFNIDPLISYKWNPFTIFYLGSTHHFHKDSGFKESERKIFAKFQYLLSL